VNIKSGELKTWLTFFIALAGMLIVFGALVLAVLVFKDAENPASTIVAVVGAVTGVIGTLAGYVAGQAAGSSGKDQAEARATEAQQNAVQAERRLGAVAGTAGEDAVEQARKLFPEWFGKAEAAPPPNDSAGTPMEGEHGT
jgi:hypothetical protein